MSKLPPIKVIRDQADLIANSVNFEHKSPEHLDTVLVTVPMLRGIYDELTDAANKLEEFLCKVEHLLACGDIQEPEGHVSWDTCKHIERLNAETADIRSGTDV